MQWTRHLEEDPGSVNLVIGNIGDHGCLGSSACYVYTLRFRFPEEIRERGQSVENYCDNYSDPCYYQAIGDVIWIHEDSKLVLDSSLLSQGQDYLFSLLTHEAGHRFDYHHPHGDDDGCDGISGCHAPAVDGSIMGYNAGRTNYFVSQDDVSRLLVPAKYNPNTFERYRVFKDGQPNSVDKWGIWIDHDFQVTGQTDPGLSSGGNLEIHDFISASGWINGTPSNTLPLSSATYTGDFLGVDMSTNYLGALLKGNANLRYKFSDKTMTLDLSRFQIYTDNRWHHQAKSFNYDLDCTANGCTSKEIQAKWYRDANDPHGWIGGVISDQVEEYVGSFLANKND